MTVKIRIRNNDKPVLVDERDAAQAEYAYDPERAGYGQLCWSWHDVLGVVRYDAEHYNRRTQRTPHIILARERVRAWSTWMATNSTVSAATSYCSRGGAGREWRG